MAEGAKTAMADYYDAHHVFPPNNLSAGWPMPCPFQADTFPVWTSMEAS